MRELVQGAEGNFGSWWFDQIAEQQTAFMAEQQRLWQRMLHVPRALELASETRVGTTPHDVVFELGTLRLLRYRRSTPARYAQPVLFCYALVNRHYILDLLPDKSVVQRYLEQGFDVYMIDWGVPTDADRHLKLHDYVNVLLKQVIDFVRGEHGGEKLHLLGYCMGGTLSALFASTYPEVVQSLTLMAAPLDFTGREALLNLWTDPAVFDVDSFVDAHGNCPALFLQTCFLFMKPVQNLYEKHVGLLEQIDDARFVTSYFAMEQWVNDNIPVAGETFREFVKKLYQQNELVRGVLDVGGRRVDLRQIRCPLLVLTAKNDHLVAPSSTEGILPHVGSSDKRAMSIDAGHVGLAVGGKAHKTFWPEATRWLVERSALLFGRQSA
ncbi:MAG: alpha/beta fold hydrolase [Polyangiaceae bacterium]